MSVQTLNFNNSTNPNAAFTAGTARRIVDANVEPVPLEELVANLRKFFVGTHEQVCDARFGEMVDIIAEQKVDVDSRLEKLTKAVSHVKDDQVGIDDSLRALSDSVGATLQNLNEEFKALVKQRDEAVARSREDLEAKIQVVVESNLEAIQDVSSQANRNLFDLSDKLFAHVSEDEKKREQERNSTHNLLEQRIAQWRAEIEDSRRNDMHEVASSMVDIGQRLMALKIH